MMRAAIGIAPSFAIRSSVYGRRRCCSATQRTIASSSAATAGAIVAGVVLFSSAAWSFTTCTAAEEAPSEVIDETTRRSGVFTFDGELKLGHAGAGRHPTQSHKSNSPSDYDSRMSPSRKIDVDVAVVGAGVFGLSTAWHLAKLGKTVAVVEREYIGSPHVASSVNAGFLENCYSTFGSRDGDDPRSVLDDLKKSSWRSKGEEETEESDLDSDSDGSSEDGEDGEEEDDDDPLPGVLFGGTLAMYAGLAARHPDLEFERMPLLELLESEEQLRLYADEWEYPLTADLLGDGEPLPPTGSIILGSDLLSKMEPMVIDARSTKNPDRNSTDEDRKVPLGAVLYPNCATIHPAKTMRAMRAEAMSEGVRVFELVHVGSVTRVCDDVGGGGCSSSSFTGDTKSCTVDDGHAPRWVVNGRTLTDHLSDSDDGEIVAVRARDVVVAAGGLTNAILRTAFRNDGGDGGDNDEVDEDGNDDDARTAPPPTAVVVPVVPVVGQMFRTAPEPGGVGRRLRHLICSAEGTTYWYTRPPTCPPEVTHERPRVEDDGDDDRGGFGAFGPRMTRHLYGKQTREGEYLFGGDRRVHPPQDVGGGFHPLPRIMEDGHDSCHHHAVDVVPAVGRLPVVHRWGGVMSFSPDGLPIAGRVVAPSGATTNGGEVDGLWVATGLGGCGFSRGGMAGLLLAEVIAGGPHASEAEEILSSSDPARFHSRIPELLKRYYL